MDELGAQSVEKHLFELERDILHALSEGNKGIRANTLRKIVRNSVNAFKLYRCINRLIDLKYIAKTQYKVSVYYSITLEGRAILDELNEILISLVHGRPLV